MSAARKAGPVATPGAPRRRCPGPLPARRVESPTPLTPRAPTPDELSLAYTLAPLIWVCGALCAASLLMVARHAFAPPPTPPDGGAPGRAAPGPLARRAPALGAGAALGGLLLHSELHAIRYPGWHETVTLPRDSWLIQLALEIDMLLIPALPICVGIALYGAWRRRPPAAGDAGVF